MDRTVSGLVINKMTTDEYKDLLTPTDTIIDIVYNYG